MMIIQNREIAVFSTYVCPSTGKGSVPVTFSEFQAILYCPNQEDSEKDEDDEKGFVGCRLRFFSMGG